MQDYSSATTSARAAHPAVAESSEDFDVSAVISDWEAIKDDFGGTSEATDIGKLMYEQGIKDERKRRRKADAARKKLPAEGWRIRNGGKSYNGEGQLCRERILERWESRVVGPFWHRRLEFGWQAVSTELYRYGNTETADARLVETAWLEEQTNPIELMWSSKTNRK